MWWSYWECRENAESGVCSFTTLRVRTQVIRRRDIKRESEKAYRDIRGLGARRGGKAGGLGGNDGLWLRGDPSKHLTFRLKVIDFALTKKGKMVLTILAVCFTLLMCFVRVHMLILNSKQWRVSIDYRDYRLQYASKKMLISAVLPSSKRSEQTLTL